MLNALTLILCCQLAGELMATAMRIPVPGPVIGMVLLFCFLLTRGSIPENLARTADGLLSHLSLLFVPAGVGVMLHFGLLGDDWLPIGLALVVSTVLTIAVTALMMTWLGRPIAGPDGSSADGEP
jgi:putative effector of murein hydrolase LrgA (UPF0299 family)